ncbi:hypothetical protein DICPUDRAFT_75318 [Dictyostelium purpureum]|uniref:F5/8 type C domain-containing protein n=1 Tax=Dictyostelium purpureum TaxID=5786 RepID=F0ZAB5_DICPU|nr:uncharacterized protein DICPUDRAFT_75318 [Dictyostelium purpureum]EGC39122.1 hypothetical protein DICPUDRAFT_75318 [Dictyostelium purpureum]|eukprot:XP_003284374.1 hypothetical protein DICPUDRAFT_75318 [Dictyostelium purpureum]
MTCPQSTADLVGLIRNALCHLRTSSNYSANNSQDNCFLNYTNDKLTSKGASESWSASIINNAQYIVAGCENPRTFVAVALQGRGDLDQWVTSYKIRYTLDNITWIDYRNGAAIQGCVDRNTVIIHYFDTPIRARSIAIHPITWHVHISLRCEFYTKPNLTPFTQVGQVNSGNNTPMLSGSGEYNVVVPVTFPVEFHKIPDITLNLQYIDCTAPQNNQVRVKVDPKNVTTKGFDAVFATWSDSKAYRLIADYSATVLE